MNPVSAEPNARVYEAQMDAQIRNVLVLREDEVWSRDHISALRQIQVQLLETEQEHKVQMTASVLTSASKL